MNQMQRDRQRECRNARKRTLYRYTEIGIPFGPRPCGCLGGHYLPDGIRCYSKSSDPRAHTTDDAEECLQCGASWRLYDRVGYA